MSNNYDKVISLGCDCMVAAQIRICLGSQVSLPFDNLITSQLISIIRLMDSKFQGIWKKVDIVDFHEDTKCEEVHDLEYNITSLHDFTKNCTNKNETLEKYKRRGSRLLNIIETANNIFFIRKCDTYTDCYFNLDDCIKKIRGDKPFLVCVCGPIPVINLPLNFIYYPIKIADPWLGDKKEWGLLFDSFGFITKKE